MIYKLTVLLDGLAFPEGPRWHEDKLWFSDIHDHCVKTVDLEGNVEKIVEIPGDPSGLGWLPDGRLLIVSMRDRRLLRCDPDGLTEVANLHHLATHHCNDMVVDAQGRAYIGNFGFDIYVPEPKPILANIVLVTPSGEARIVAEDMDFPNGSVITPDGTTFIVAETFGQRLTAFDIAEDGSLSNRRVWAQFDELNGPVLPDGICLDAEGAIWVPSVRSSQVFRVREGGEITDRIQVETDAFACMLGGPDRKTLFVLTAETSNPQEAKAKKSGRIEIVTVEVPGAGFP